MDIKLDNDSTDTIAKTEDGKSPSNMFSINSHYNINNDWEFDNALYYTGSINGSTGDKHAVNDYLKLDAKVTYRPTEGVETSLIGQNLLDDKHQEFGSAVYSEPYEIPRSVFGKVTVRF
jgi:iron complex outermembrane receptor protein